MNVSHNISDLIIRIKNASLAKRRETLIPFTNMNKKVLDLLVKEGFITSAKTEEKEGLKKIRVGIKYDKRNAALNGVSILSKPSLRIYKRKNEISQIEKRGRHIVFISTSQGIMTGAEARQKGVGGEVLFEIW